ncbi:MAG: hypothetical protein ABFE08_03105 [Armatimonadia bacterium]
MKSARGVAITILCIQLLLIVAAGCGEQATESSLFRAAEKYCRDKNEQAKPTLSSSGTKLQSFWQVLYDKERDVRKTDSVVYPYEGAVQVLEICREWDTKSQTWVEAYRFAETILTFRFHEGHWELYSEGH